MENNIQMLQCPACGEYTLHPKRKELGYHVCVNCSSTDRVVGITTVEGTGDHTWNDIIIMDRKKAMAIAAKEAELKGDRKGLSEILDFETDDMAVSQSVKEKVHNTLNDENYQDENETFDPDRKYKGIQGIDY